MTEHQSCVLGHSRDPDRPRRAVDGLLVCYGHLVHGIAHDLAELPQLDQRLAEMHNPAGRAGPKTSGTRDLGLNYNDRVARQRGDIYTSLAGWARLTAEEGRWHPPHDTVPGIAAWLLGPRGTRLRWTAARPWVDEYAEDVARTAREAFRLAYPVGGRLVDVGPCDRALACDVATRTELVCYGTLRATVHDADELLPAELVCDECCWPVPPRYWVRLARRLGRGTAWLTGQQLAGLWAVPVGTIRRWAHQAGWARRGRNPTWYDAHAAQATYDQRTAGRERIGA